jgi:4-hydroxy-3-methylbut-2-enyl diphosphate reductase IspH
VDATCPLVTRVHRSVLQHAKQDRPIVLIGHAGHDEVIGTTGEAPDQVHLVQTPQDVAALPLDVDAEVAYVTQTTLSVDETAAIIAALEARFANLVQPGKDDICYATTNRQTAVKDLVARGASHVLVVGSRNSSNSVRLCEVARRGGAEATLVDGVAEVDPEALAGHEVLGLTAGASAPERLVREGASHVLVVGSANSSNSVRLCEVARRGGADATLIDSPRQPPLAELAGHATLGLTAGASAPERLVQEVVARLRAAGWQPQEVDGVEENVQFKMPRELAAFEAASSGRPEDS